MTEGLDLTTYAPKKLVEAAKTLWPYLEDNELTFVLIGAHWGYNKAVNEMHMTLFGMTQDEERNDTERTIN